MIFFALKHISETCLDQERSFAIQTPKYLKEDTLLRVFPMTLVELEVYSNNQTEVVSAAFWCIESVSAEELLRTYTTLFKK